MTIHCEPEKISIGEHVLDWHLSDDNSGYLRCQVSFNVHIEFLDANSFLSQYSKFGKRLDGLASSGKHTQNVEPNLIRTDRSAHRSLHLPRHHTIANESALTVLLRGLHCPTVT